MIHIRTAKEGDENTLAYIQTKSWKAAFKNIIPMDLLEKCTDINRATNMYKRLLAKDKGYGSKMMDRILEDVKCAGFSKIMLWVFTENHRAISFYEAHGFVSSGRTQPAFEAEEKMYIRDNL
ncbi:MAG: GNAT family N-acetyltransferase [Roseburia sp.]